MRGMALPALKAGKSLATRAKGAASPQEEEKEKEKAPARESEKVGAERREARPLQDSGGARESLRCPNLEQKA